MFQVVDIPGNLSKLAFKKKKIEKIAHKLRGLKDRCIVYAILAL